VAASYRQEMPDNFQFLCNDFYEWQGGAQPQSRGEAILVADGWEEVVDSAIKGVISVSIGFKTLRKHNSSCFGMMTWLRRRGTEETLSTKASCLFARRKNYLCIFV
jgi:hypothetical protein